MKKMIILFVCLVPLKVASQVNQMKIAYTVAEHDAVPEGLAYDPVENIFYISSTYKRKIIKLGTDGKASDFIKEQQDGIHGVVGMRVDAKKRDPMGCEWRCGKRHADQKQRQPGMGVLRNV